jgi:hypothetical protein
MATPPSETRHVALFGGPRALARAMRVCETNQDFQVTGCEKLGAFYGCQLASREGEASKLGALYRKEAQRRGLGCTASLGALRGARKAFSKQSKSLGTLPDFVAQLRPGNAKSVSQDVRLDLPREIRTEQPDWAFALSSVLGALEAFPHLAKVQQAGLVELRKWAESQIPDERRAAVPKPGPRSRKTGLAELPVDYKLKFGGIPQFPGPLFPGQPTPGGSEDVAGDHLLLLRGLRVATSAAESFPFESDCGNAALSALVDLLPLAFDLEGYTGQLKQGASEVAGQTAHKATTMPSKALSLETGSQSVMDLPTQALLQTLNLVTQVVSTVIRVLQKYLDEHADARMDVQIRRWVRTGPAPDLPPLVEHNLREIMAAPSALYVAYRRLVMRARKPLSEAQEKESASEERDAPEGRLPKEGSSPSEEDGRADGSESKSPSLHREGQPHSNIQPSKALPSANAPEFLSRLAEEAGLPAVLEAALQAGGELLETPGLSRDGLIQAAGGMLHLYHMYEEMNIGKGGALKELHVEGGPKQPFGVFWRRSGLQSVFFKLVHFDDMVVDLEDFGDNNNELGAALEGARALTEAIGAACGIPGVRQGLARALYHDSDALDNLVATLRRPLGWWDLANIRKCEKAFVPSAKPPYEFALHAAVSGLFRECPELSVAPVGVRGALMVEDFLWGLARKEPVRACC